MLVAHVVSLAKARGQRFVVIRQLSDHVQGLDVFRIVIEHALSSRNVADRSQRKSSDLSNSLRDWIGHGEKLIRVFVEEQLVIADKHLIWFIFVGLPISPSIGTSAIARS